MGPSPAVPTVIVNEPGFWLTLLAILIGTFIGAAGSFLAGRSQAKHQARWQRQLRREDQEEAALIELLPVLRAVRDAVKKVTSWNDDELIAMIDTNEK